MSRGQKIAILIGTIVFALMVWVPAHAQTGAHGDGHSEMHEWYKNLINPQDVTKTPGSCCNERVVHEDGKITGDCRRVRAHLHENGVDWIAIVEGKEVFVHHSNIVVGEVAPDGNAHLCMSEAGFIFCFIVPQPKS